MKEKIKILKYFTIHIFYLLLQKKKIIKIY